MGCRASRIAGISVLHELVAVHANDLAEVVIGIETDRGLWVQALTSPEARSSQAVSAGDYRVACWFELGT